MKRQPFVRRDDIVGKTIVKQNSPDTLHYSCRPDYSPSHLSRTYVDTARHGEVGSTVTSLTGKVCRTRRRWRDIHDVFVSVAWFVSFLLFVFAVN